MKTAIPDDLIERQFKGAIFNPKGISENEINESAREIRLNLKLDLPLFYFSFQSAIIPDSIYTMYPIGNGKFYKKLLIKFGCEEQTANYYRMLLKIKQNGNEEQIDLYNHLFGKVDEKHIKEILTNAPLESEIRPVVDAYDQMVLYQNRFVPTIPAFRWHGSNNQFHIWFWNMLHFDFGKSIVDGLRVSGKIGLALINMLIITIPALMAIFMICIPLGTWLSGNNSKKASMINTILYGFDAVPLFWLSLILIILFASNNFLNIFPVFGFNISTEKNQISFYRITGLILPVVALILSNLAYVSKQVSKSIDDQKNQLYVLSARARGLTARSVLWVHIFKNSLIPIITIFSDYLTPIFAGSFVLEIVFSIPGMGKLLFDSVLNKDFPVILAILMLTASIKILSHLTADIGYKMVKPAIKY